MSACIINWLLQSADKDVIWLEPLPISVSGFICTLFLLTLCMVLSGNWVTLQCSFSQGRLSKPAHGIVVLFLPC